jgi:AbiV family abortive infection protein
MQRQPQQHSGIGEQALPDHRRQQVGPGYNERALCAPLAVAPHERSITDPLQGGPLYGEEMEEHGSLTMVVITANAEELLSSAKLLQQANSFRVATSLAILSMEESAKGCLVFWKLTGLIDRDIKKDIRHGHLDKHRLFAAYDITQLMITMMDSAKTIADLKGAMRRPQGGKFLKSMLKVARAENGAYDALKQAGFYIDLDEDLTVKIPKHQADKAACAQAIADAELGIQILMQSARDHGFLSAVYEAGPQFRFTKQEAASFEKMFAFLDEPNAPGSDN